MQYKRYVVVLRPEEVLQLDHIAKKYDRSRSYLLRSVIKDFLEQKQKIEEDDKNAHRPG